MTPYEAFLWSMSVMTAVAMALVAYIAYKHKHRNH